MQAACPYCKATVSHDGRFSGMTLPCQACGRPYRVPSPEAAVNPSALSPDAPTPDAVSPAAPTASQPGQLPKPHRGQNGALSSDGGDYGIGSAEVIDIAQLQADPPEDGGDFGIGSAEVIDVTQRAVVHEHSTEVGMDREEIGAMGGNARAARLTPERRSEIGRPAVQTQWSKTPEDRRREVLRYIDKTLQFIRLCGAGDVRLWRLEELREWVENLPSRRLPVSPEQTWPAETDDSAGRKTPNVPCTPARCFRSADELRQWMIATIQTGTRLACSPGEAYREVDSMIGTGLVLVSPKIDLESIVAWSTVFAAYERAIAEGAIDGRKVPDPRSFVLAVLSRLPASHWKDRAAQTPTSPTIDEGSRNEHAKRVAQTPRLNSAEELRDWMTAALPWGALLLDVTGACEIHTVTTGLVSTSIATNQEIRTVEWSELFVAYEGAVAAGAIDRLRLSDLSSVVRILLERLPTEKKMLPINIVPIRATANPVPR